MSWRINMNDYWDSFDCEIQCDEFELFKYEYDPIDDENLPFN